MSTDAAVSSLLGFGRRDLFARGAVLLTALLGECAADVEPTDDAAAQHDAALPRNAPTLFYVSAPDCPWCRKWNRVFLATFEASVVRARLRFVILHSPSVRVSWSSDQVWPQDVGWVRAALDARQVRHVVPLFVLVQKGAYVASVAGYDQRYDYGWHGDFYGTVLKAVGLT
jgi:hypothetical protein